MARTLRIDLPHGVHHVMDRGNERKPIFLDDVDRQRFLRMLAEMSDRFSLLLHAFVLMLNHYHLMPEAPNGGLSAGMQWLNGSYSRYFNWRHNRVGHVFQGRFKSVPVLNERYFVSVSRYIHMNPVKAGIVTKPWDYPWSSCGYLSGMSPAPKWVQTERTLDFFGDNPSDYRAFLEEQADDLISEAVARDISTPDPDDHPMPECGMLMMKAETVVVASGYAVEGPRAIGKNLIIFLLHSQGVKQKELAQIFGVSPSAVNQRITKLEAEIIQNPGLSKDLAFLRTRLKS